MALFDSLNKMAKNLGEMAGDAMENGKLNIKIMEEKAGMTEAYAQLGEVVYNQYKTGEDQSPRIMELIAKIDGHKQAIEAAQAPAPQPAPAYTAPAPAYGTPQAAPAAPAAEEAPAAEPACEEPVCEAPACEEPACEAPAAAPKFCSGCGAKLDEGARFCGNCGTPA